MENYCGKLPETAICPVYGTYWRLGPAHSGGFEAKRRRRGTLPARLVGHAWPPKLQRYAAKTGRAASRFFIANRPGLAPSSGVPRLGAAVGLWRRSGAFCGRPPPGSRRGRLCARGGLLAARRGGCGPAPRPYHTAPPSRKGQDKRRPRGGPPPLPSAGRRGLLGACPARSRLPLAGPPGPLSAAAPPQAGAESRRWRLSGDAKRPRLLCVWGCVSCARRCRGRSGPPCPPPVPPAPRGGRGEARRLTPAAAGTAARWPTLPRYQSTPPRQKLHKTSLFCSIMRTLKSDRSPVFASIFLHEQLSVRARFDFMFLKFYWRIHDSSPFSLNPPREAHREWLPRYCVPGSAAAPENLPVR